MRTTHGTLLFKCLTLAKKTSKKPAQHCLERDSSRVLQYVDEGYILYVDADMMRE